MRVAALFTRADRPRVLDVSRGRTRVETGAGVDPAATGKAAVVAQYTPHERQSRSLLELIRGLAGAGYRCVVVATAPAAGELAWPGPLPEGTIVVRRPNIGYDFGSWAVGLDLYPEVTGLEHVILTNDSMVGPFSALDPLLETFEHGRTDVWSLTDSYQLGHHLQSFFVGFRGGVLSEPGLRDFYRRVRVEKTKEDVVNRYEVGLTRACLRGGFSMMSQYRANDLGVGLENPTLAGWHELLTLGFPFVKRTLVTDPSTAPGAENVGAVVRRMFGTDLADWL